MKKFGQLGDSRPLRLVWRHSRGPMEGRLATCGTADCQSALRWRDPID